MIKYNITTTVNGAHQMNQVWASCDLHAKNIAKMILGKRLQGLEVEESGFAYGVKIPLERKD